MTVASLIAEAERHLLNARSALSHLLPPARTPHVEGGNTGCPSCARIRTADGTRPHYTSTDGGRVHCHGCERYLCANGVLPPIWWLTMGRDGIRRTTTLVAAHQAADRAAAAKKKRRKAS